MKFIKVLGALLLLISSNTFSFSNLEVSINQSNFDHLDSSNLEKESQQVYDSHLTSYNNIFKIPSLNLSQNFGFLSTYIESLDNQYLFYSYLIIPGFDLGKILFPFHSFL